MVEPGFLEAALHGYLVAVSLILAIGAPRHGAQRRHFRNIAELFEIGAFGRIRPAMDQFDLEIAADQCLTLAGNTFGHAARYRANRGDRRHAEDDAGEEHAEAAQAAAKLAQGKADGDEKAGPCIGANVAWCHDGTAASAPIPSGTTLPDCNCAIRSERLASPRSWVTSTRVVPRFACVSNRRSVMSAPLAASRLPVGSSASRIAGPGTSALAIATRCCSPPESWAG